jgi:GntR family transcriptional repressor for pyruvate dehydrogenase complex
MLRAVKQKRVYQDIVAQIQGMLDEGQLKPGHQLPSERELVELFRVSRASVREAMRALESMGFVEIRSGEGTYVATTVDSLLSPLAFAIREQKDPYREIFEARTILEPQIAALAAERASPSDVKKLEAILEEQAKQIAQGETGVEADTAFHSALAYIVRNKVFLRINEAIVESFREVRERSLQGERRPARSLAGHREILKAIRAKDPAGARRAMLEHLETIERNIARLRASDRRQEKQRVLGRLSRVQ